MSKAAAEKSVSADNLVQLAHTVKATGPLWVRKLRQDALAQLGASGFPGPKDESWRQTRIAPITSTTYLRGSHEPGSVERSTVDPRRLGDLSCPRLVLVNGHFAPELSDMGTLPEGVRVIGLATALESSPEIVEPHLGAIVSPESRPFAALNTASFDDGVVIALDAGRALETPIEIVYLSSAAETPIVTHPRTLVVLGDNAQAEIIEAYLGGDGDIYFTNAVTEIALGDNAVLNHARVQWESRGAYHVGSIQARLARGANYVSHNVSFGAALARHDVGAVMGGAGAEATLNGLYLVRGAQHVDNHTTLDHAEAHCPSHELYKGILTDRARAVFNGRIIVREDAQKTDAKQSNKNLLLSDDALVHTRPQLEIYADDVRCTHGATIGQLEDDALFYLRARGIGVDDARSILIYAFASDVLDRIRHAPLREKLQAEMMSIVGNALSPGAEA